MRRFSVVSFVMAVAALGSGIAANEPTLRVALFALATFGFTFSATRFFPFAPPAISGSPVSFVLYGTVPAFASAGLFLAARFATFFTYEPFGVLVSVFFGICFAAGFFTFFASPVPVAGARCEEQAAAKS